jgi:hypothetical protein
MVSFIMEHSDSEIPFPLSAITEAFEDLSEKVKGIKNGSIQHLRLDNFCEIASLVSVLFRCLGLAFKFAEMEYVAKVCIFIFIYWIIVMYYFNGWILNIKKIRLITCSMRI